MQEVCIGDNVATIYNGMFSGCSNLKKVTLGSGLKYIRNEAFKDCTGLETLICKAEEPPYCYPNVFANVNVGQCVLEVPVGALDAYQSANAWKDFYYIYIISGVSDVKDCSAQIQTNGGALTIQGTEAGEQVVVYNVAGQKMGEGVSADGKTVVETTLRRGDIAIVKIGDKSVKVLMK